MKNRMGRGEMGIGCWENGEKKKVVGLFIYILTYWIMMDISRGV